MRTTTRTAAAVLAAAVTFGAGAPVAAAAGHADHAKPGHVKVSKGEHGKKGEQATRQLLRDIAKTDARLVKVVRESRTARIGDHAAGVRANVAADRAQLAELAAAVQAPGGTVDAHSVRAEVKGLRVQNYGKVINDLRHAIKLSAQIAEARAGFDGDLAAPVAELDAAQAAVDAAIAKALLITASSDAPELRAVKDDLRTAHEALEGISGSDDDFDDESEEPVEDQPVEDEPVEDPID